MHWTDFAEEITKEGEQESELKLKFKTTIVNELRELNKTNKEIKALLVFITHQLDRSK